MYVGISCCSLIETFMTRIRKYETKRNSLSGRALPTIIEEKRARNHCRKDSFVTEGLRVFERVHMPETESTIGERVEGKVRKCLTYRKTIQV